MLFARKGLSQKWYTLVQYVVVSFYRHSRNFSGIRVPYTNVWLCVSSGALWHYSNERDITDYPLQLKNGCWVLPETMVLY